ncbi:hypothetical protein ON010_g6998 [Phytophthora cinnamomi]|nr:hypothetical protein ON010_g6998 [Phytophthora cinnamomi]
MAQIAAVRLARFSSSRYSHIDNTAQFAPVRSARLGSSHTSQVSTKVQVVPVQVKQCQFQKLVCRLAETHVIIGRTITSAIRWDRRAISKASHAHTKV